MEKSFEEFLQEEQGKNPKTIRSKDFCVHKIAKERPEKIVNRKMITLTTEKEVDFLKYYIIVEHYFLKFVFPELTAKEMKLLFMLYSEPPFTHRDFMDFTELLNWNDSRFQTWIQKDILVEYKKPKLKYNRKATRRVNLYTLSQTTKRQIKSFYDKLLLRYKFSERPQHNPLFRENTRSYTDKHYAKKIKQINSGKIGSNKIDEDWYQGENMSFKDFVEQYNQENNEELITLHDYSDMRQDEIKERRERREN